MSFAPKQPPGHWRTIGLCWATGLLLALVVAAAQSAEGRWITAEVTAYAGNCPLCETAGVTANGTLTASRPYGVASSPDVPMGSRVFVPAGCGYLDEHSPVDRWFTCDDRGGALRSEWRRSGITRIDLRYRTHASAKAFGRKLMLVFIADS